MVALCVEAGDEALGLGAKHLIQADARLLTGYHLQQMIPALTPSLRKAA